MLSAKKVLLHGMNDKRWTTKDKITQYKGLVPLFQRDRKIEGYDKAVVKKQQKKICRKLGKSLTKHREALDNCIRGDRQEIRNCLDVDNQLKLALQDLPIGEIVEHIHQENFNLRKTLDRLMYRIKLRTKTLIKYKLDVAMYEDILKEIQTSNEVEIKSKKVSADVQDVILKRDAAIRVSVIYKQVISYMRKDRVYFDAVLNSLQLDIRTQNDCMLQAIKLGQITTEQRNDRTNEYNKILTIVKQYQELWKKKNKNVFYKAKNMKGLMPKSTENLSRLNYDLQSRTKLNEFRELQEIVDKLKEITNTTKMFEVLPCMETQKENSIKLNEMIKKSTEGKEILTEKLNHARLSYENYICLTNEPLSYKEEVERLQEKIRLKTEKIQKIKAQQDSLNDLCTKLDAATAQIATKCTPARITCEYLSRHPPMFTSYYQKYPFLERFDQMFLKIAFLVSTYPDLYSMKLPQRAESLYANLIRTSSDSQFKIAKKTGSYLHFKKAEDPFIPTREGIKENSYEFAAKAKMLLDNFR